MHIKHPAVPRLKVWKGLFMSKTVAIRLIPAILPMLVFSGCVDEQRRKDQRYEAVELYTDAVMLLELENSQVAVQKLRDAVEADPEFGMAYSLLGKIHRQAGRYEQSAAAYEQATQVNPWSFTDYYNLGQVYAAMKQTEKAYAAYAKACELKPKHLSAHILATKTAYQLDDYQAALQFGEKAVAMNPRDAAIYKIVGSIYSSNEDYQSAIDAYKRALEIEGNNSDIMLALALAYVKIGRYGPARGLLSAVTRMQPDNAEAHQYLGYCNLRLNNLDTAIADYVRAVNLDKRDWRTRRGLGIAYVMKAMKTNDKQLKQRAIQQWRKSLELKPDQENREALLTLIHKYSQ